MTENKEDGAAQEYMTARDSLPMQASRCGAIVACPMATTPVFSVRVSRQSQLEQSRALGRRLQHALSQAMAGGTRPRRPRGRARSADSTLIAAQRSMGFLQLAGPADFSPSRCSAFPSAAPSHAFCPAGHNCHASDA